MKKTIHNFLMVLALCLSVNTTFSQYLVTGSTYQDVNGIYESYNTVNNKTSYSNDFYEIHAKSCVRSSWGLRLLANSCPRYSSKYGETIEDGEFYYGRMGQIGSMQKLQITPLNNISVNQNFFIESPQNDGSFNGSINLVLYAIENPFSGNNGDDFIADGKITVNNLPDGLSMQIIRTGDSLLVAKLIGNASNHALSDSANNISLQFLDAAFTDKDASEINGTAINISLYFSKTFYACGAKSSSLANGVYYLVSKSYNYPIYRNKNNIHVYHKTCSNSDIEWAVNGSNCPYYSTNTVGSDLPTTGWHKGGGNNKSKEAIYFYEENSFAIDNKILNESSANDGSIADSINLTMFATATTFTGANGDDFIADGKITLSYIPAGYTYKAIRKNDTLITITFSNSTALHSTANNVGNISIQILQSAVNNDYASINNASFNNLQLRYFDQYVFVVGATITPEVNGLYAIAGTQNNQPYYVNGSMYIYYKGCSNGTEWAIDNTLSGCPYYSTLVQGNSPYVSGWANGGRFATKTDSIQILPANSIIYSLKTLTENQTLPGVISDSIDVYFAYASNGNAFTGTDGDDFIADSKITISNIPAGLTAQAIRTSDTTLYIKFIGAATNHESFNNATLTIKFEETALLSGTSNVNYCSVNDILINFIEYYEVIGATDDPNANGSYKVNGNLINNKIVLEKGIYRIGYRNCYSKWVLINSNDDNKVKQGGGCPEYATQSTGDTPDVDAWGSGRGGSGTDKIQVIKHNSLLLNKYSINESIADDGSIVDSLVLTYAFAALNNSFSGNIGDDFVASGKLLVNNLPVGLTASAIKLTDTTLVIKILGQATNHNFNDNVYDISLSIQNSAYSNGDATQVITNKLQNISLFFCKFVEVINATKHPNVNGTYYAIGYENGKLIYAKNEFRIGYRNCTNKWVIVDGNSNNNVNQGYCPAYASSTVSDSPVGINWDGRSSANDGIKVVEHNSLFYSTSNINTASFSETLYDSIQVRYIFPSNNNSFSGTVGDNFISDGKLNITNLPTYISAQGIKTSDSTVVIKFISSNLFDRPNNEDINGIKISFQNSAFINGDTNQLINPSLANVAIHFTPVYIVTNESISSLNGQYTCMGEYNSKPYFSDGSHYIFYKNFNTKWAISSSFSSTFPFDKSTVDSDLPSLTEWQNNSILSIANSLVYSKTLFTETPEHIGAIDNTDTLIIEYKRIQDAAFAGSNGDDFVALGCLTVSNLPIGLQVIATRTSDTTLAVVFNGTCASADINNLTFTFNDNAFINMKSKLIYDVIKDDLAIDFANIFYVASSGGDFTTISSALKSKKVKNGDILILAAETFTEYELSTIKSLTIKGQGAKNTIIQAATSPKALKAHIFNLNSNNYSGQHLIIEDVTLQNGYHDYGGCIYARNIELTLRNCLLQNAIAQSYGGAIYSQSSCIISENCTFTNDSSQRGGAMCLYYSSSTIGKYSSFTNCTFTNNKAVSYGGAAYFNAYANLINCTLSENTAGYGGGIYRINYSVNLTNTIVANNSASTAGPDINGSINADYCFIGNTADATINGSNNLVDVDPELNVLAENGGPLPTCALNATSTAIDAGTNTNTPTIDERGIETFNGIKDMGAYEYNTTPTINISDSALYCGNMILGDSCELVLHISGINLSNDYAVKVSGNSQISSYTGLSFAANSILTFTPSSGNLSDTSIFIKVKPNIIGDYIDTLKCYSDDFADTIKIVIKAKVVTEPTGDNSTVNLNEDEEGYFTSSDFPFTDLDGGVFSGISITSKETNGDLEYNGLNITNGTVCSDISKLSFKTYPNDYGDAYATFTFNVIDNSNVKSTSEYTMTINVIGINDTPESANINISTNEDETYTFGSNEFVFNDPEDTDISGVQLTAIPNKGTLSYNSSTVSLNTTYPTPSLFSYLPNNNENGDAYSSFNFKVVDSEGALSIESYSATVNVSAVNDAPTSTDKAITAYKNEVYAFSNADIPFTDVDGDAFGSVVINTIPAKGTLSYDGTAVVAGNTYATISKFSYEPLANELGSDYASFTFTVKDALNTQSVIDNKISFNVVVRNNLPTSTNGSVSVSEDVTLSFTSTNFAFNDIDADAFGGIKIISNVTNGTLKSNGNSIVLNTLYQTVSELTYTPNENQYGSDNFTFKVVDAQGGVSASSYTMTISITPVGDAPLSANNTMNINEDESLTFTSNNFTFSDVDGDTFAGIQIISDVTYGTLKYDGSAIALNTDYAIIAKLTYVPDENLFGTDNFTFKVKDDNGDYSVESYIMTIDVAGVNDAPIVAIAIADDITYVDSSYSYILNSNTFNDIDSETLKLSATLANGSALPSWLRFNASNAEFSGIPTEAGEITIAVKASDNLSASVSDEFVLTVKNGVSISTLSSNKTLIFPNPASLNMFVKIEKPSQTMTITIVDLLGKSVYVNESVEPLNEINVANFNHGIYFVKIIENNKIIELQKIIVE